MTTKKRQSIRRIPDLTVEGDSLTVFTDNPRGDGIRLLSQEVITRYDPAVTALGEWVRRKAAHKRHVQSVARILEDCLRTAVAIKNKHGTELVKLLRDARRQVELIDLR